MLLSKIVELIKKGQSNFINAKIYRDINIEKASAIDVAKNYEISFLEDNNVLKGSISETNASAIIVSDKFELTETISDKKISLVIVKNPRIDRGK